MIHLRSSGNVDPPLMKLPHQAWTSLVKYCILTCLSPEKEPQVLMIQKVMEKEELKEQYLPQLASECFNIDHLPKDHQSQVRPLCHSYLFSEYPGSSTFIDHEIVLKSDAVGKRMGYRIPECLHASLRKESDLMLTLGIIEPSKSEWCHLVV